MNEELYIKSRMGDKNPFRVPDGYFDNLVADVMTSLPEQPKRSMMVRMRPWLYAAACLLVAVFTVTVYFLAPETYSQDAVATATEFSDTYVEEVADYVMADNNDIYACLASNDY